MPNEERVEEDSRVKIDVKPLFNAEVTNIEDMLVGFTNNELFTLAALVREPMPRSALAVHDISVIMMASYHRNANTKIGDMPDKKLDEAIAHAKAAEATRNDVGKLEKMLQRFGEKSPVYNTTVRILKSFEDVGLAIRRKERTGKNSRELWFANPKLLSMWRKRKSEMADELAKERPRKHIYDSRVLFFFISM